MNKSSHTGKIFIFLLSILLILTCTLPLFFVGLNASKDEREYSISKFSLPKNFTLFEKFDKLFIRGRFGNYILNTLVVVVVGISTSLVLCSMAGYAFDKLEFPKKNLIYLGFISMLAIPLQALIVPLYAMCSKWNLVDNLVMMGVLHATFSLAFGTFLMRSFYHGIPNAVIDSAKIDGASSFQVYYKIMLPLARPALVTLGTLNFFSFWNELFLSMIFLRSSEVKVVTPAIAALQTAARGGRMTDWPLLFAGMLLSIIVPLIVYFITHRRIARGMTIGALKY